MKVRFWGTRGSIATPGGQTARYGGNTSCVEVRSVDGTLIVLDCGTGARELGVRLAASEASPLRVHLFIGHTHWDHIQGFPFFEPAFRPGTELNIYAPLGFQRGLEEAMAGQMEHSYFPVTLRELRSRIHFTELDEGFFRVGDVLVETQYLNHTAPTIAYRMSNGGAIVVYVTDHEPFWHVQGGVSQHPGDERHVEFLRGADLVIHDAQYTEDEYRQKIGWGHGSIDYAVNVAAAADVGRLVLFHHDPDHDDAAIDALVSAARALVPARTSGLDVIAAMEGLELEVRGRGDAQARALASALQHRQVVGGRVLIVSGNQHDISAIDAVLTADGLLLVRVPDVRSAVIRGPELMPDLAIVDRQLLADPRGPSLDDLRAALARPDLPVVVLADTSVDPEVVYRGESPSTDYLAKPFSPPMLRARVRAWLARTLQAAPGQGAGPAAAAAGAGRVGRRGQPADQSRLLALLATVPLFRGLSAGLRAGLIAQGSEEIFVPGQVLIRQGEPADSLFVILAGRVRVLEASTEASNEMLLGELGDGELLGELGVLRHQARSASVVAVERTHCLVLNQHDFVRTLQSSVDLAIALLQTLAGRLYEADRRLLRYAPDPITGLAGRRAFHEQYRRLAAVARRRKTGVLMIVADVEQLREVNDRYGYTAGDDVLRAVGDSLIHATRTTDLVARHGGDEFVVFLPDAREEDSSTVLARMNEKLVEFARQRELPLVPVCKTGVVYTESPPEAADDLLRDADRDMHNRARSPRA